MILQSNDSLVKSVLQEEREIIFLDPTVEDYQSLIAGINPDTKVVILDQMKDGISQITENLQGGKYKAVHIVSHGGEGSLQLGSNQLNSGNLDTYKSQLQQWANFLTDDADILLYGCDVAAGQTGVGFVQQLSQLTGADVAASDDLTGSAALGGDWDLEVSTGKIESPLAFQTSVLEGYNGILASSNIVISQIYGGGGNSDAPYKNDFIELFNRGATPINVTGWSVQYAANNNIINSLIWNVTNLSGVIAPAGYYLIQLGGLANGAGANLPTANATDTINISATSGNVALVKNQIPLGIVNVIGANIVDFLGYGSAANYYETSPTPAPSNTRSVVRKGGNPDTDNNFADFVTGVPNPRNSAVNGTPILGLSASALPYTENAGFVVIDNTIAVSDSDSTNFNGGKLIVDFASGANTNDILLIRNDTTNGITVALNNISIGGQLIGTFTGGLNGTPLNVTFNAQATPTRVQTLIRNIIYGNISDNPMAGDRTVRFRLTDDTGLTSAPVTKTISLTAVNDAPVIAIPGASFDIYNGTGTPNSQGFIYQTLPYLPTGTIQNGNQLNTSTTITDYVGYAAKAELMPILDRNTGYSIKFSAQITSENHSNSGADKNGDGKADRAGFSVTVIGNDKKGLELGFWTNEIWAQNDGIAEPPGGNLFTHGEGTTNFTTTTQKSYELKILGNNYSLFADNNQNAILSGNLRDYTSSTTPAFLPSNPYNTPNFLFFGDNTPTSSADFKLGAISITTGSTPGSISVNEDTGINVKGVSINDVDSGSVTATLKVNSGKLTVSTGISGGVTSVNNNGTGEVILSGTLSQINNTSAATNGLTYKGNQDFFGNDTFSVSATDGITPGSPKTVSIIVNPVNNRPTFTIGNNQSVKAGAGQQTIALWASNFNSGAANETQSVAGYIVKVVNEINADIFDVAPTINLAGDLIYTAKSGITASKTATIEVKVQDNGGTLNGGVDTSAPQTFTITVNPTATNSINGTPNPDTLMGTDQSDRISGLDSDDIIYGGLGSDRIFGNNGNDILYGDLGIKSDNSDIQPAYGLTFTMNDTIAGSAGNDKIYGNLGNDKLYGDEGDDVIWGGDGDDEIWGGYGNDTLSGGAGKDAFVLVRGQGADIIMDFKSEDVLGCAGALTYSSLKFTPTNGDTLITDKATSELLATLKGFTGIPNYGGLF
ncbi:MAG: DUF4347 domain-containing protein [Hassallia sp. WJT32-NPBG1]|jgi:hypothetical protein|nr:DUF4347 domain-containing protein [Hassallia sp. WJT32-NPBG1]